MHPYGRRKTIWAFVYTSPLKNMEKYEILKILIFIFYSQNEKGLNKPTIPHNLLAVQS